MQSVSPENYKKLLAKLEKLEAQVDKMSGQMKKAAAQAKKDAVAKRLPAKEEVFAALKKSIEYVAGAAVEGDFAEFGVGSGRSTRNFSMAIGALGLERPIHLFDSFVGLPVSTLDGDVDSPHVKDGTWAEGNCNYGSTVESVTQKAGQFVDPKLLKFYVGWFEETLKDIPTDTKFAFLHVDCDLYESTMQIFDYLLPRAMVSEGAIICWDDWNCNMSSDRFGERKAWLELISKYDIKFTHLGPYGWGGWRTIVHSYK